MTVLIVQSKQDGGRTHAREHRWGRWEMDKER